MALVGLATGAAALDGLDVANWASSETIRVQIAGGNGVLSGVARRGGPHHDVNDLRLSDPEAVVSFGARVTLLELDAGGTVSESGPRAGLAACFYWDGSGSGLTGDWTGHVLAAFTVGVDETTGAIRARYAVDRCVDASCSRQENLAAGAAASGALSLFEPRVLSVGYDGQAFVFQLDAIAPIRVVPPGSTRRTTPNTFRALRTEASTGDVPQATARVLALFERVEVNGSLYDDFGGTAYPRVRITPASGWMASTQVIDVALLVDGGPDPIVGGRLLVDGRDITASVGAHALVEALTGGAVAVRFPGLRLGRLLPPARPVVFAAEVWTAGGAVGRDFAVWERLDVTEP